MDEATNGTEGSQRRDGLKLIIVRYCDDNESTDALIILSSKAIINNKHSFLIDYVLHCIMTKQREPYVLWTTV